MSGSRERGARGHSSWRMRMACHGLLLAALAGVLCGCTSLDVAAPSHAAAAQRKLLVTGYCRCGDCCGWKRNWLFRPVNTTGPQKGERKAVGVTASGTRAQPGVISADHRRYPVGTVMYVPGYGYGRVEDRGSGVLDDHIEVFFNSHRQATAWGRRQLAVRIWTPAQNSMPGRGG